MPQITIKPRTGLLRGETVFTTNGQAGVFTRVDQWLVTWFDNTETPIFKDKRHFATWLRKHLPMPPIILQKTERIYD